MNSRIRVLIFSFLIAVFVLPIQVWAEGGVNTETVSPCGKALAGGTPLVGGYCDIYQRQIDFMLNSMKFTKSIEARRESFVKLQWEAIEDYRVNLTKAYEKLAQEEEKEKIRKKREMEREVRREEMRKKREAEREARMKEREAEREARMKEREAEREARKKENEAEAEKRNKSNKEDKEQMPEDEDNSASLKETSEEKTALVEERAEDIEPAAGADETEEKMANASGPAGVREKEMPAAVDEAGNEKSRKVIMPEDAPEFDDNPFD